MSLSIFTPVLMEVFPPHPAVSPTAPRTIQVESRYSFTPVTLALLREIWTYFSLSARHYDINRILTVDLLLLTRHFGPRAIFSQSACIHNNTHSTCFCRMIQRVSRFPQKTLKVSISR